MAKKKTIEAPENVAPEIEPAETSVTEAPSPAEEMPKEAIPSDVCEEAAEPEKEDEPSKTAPAVDLSALPVQAVDYLKRHPEVDAVYIDKFGGMFPKHTPKVFVNEAVLYQNPYFKQ